MGGYSYEFATYAYDFGKNEILGYTCAIVYAQSQFYCHGRRAFSEMRGDYPEHEDSERCGEQAYKRRYSYLYPPGEFERLEEELRRYKEKSDDLDDV